MRFPELESNINIIINALAGNIDGALFFLKYITIQDTESSSVAIELLYKKVVTILGRDQRFIAMKVVNSLKTIRKIVISDEDAMKILNDRIESRRSNS